MAKFTVLIFCILLSHLANAQTISIYSKAYGESKNPPIIFIHGGPGGNSTLFEGTTAKVLAEKGFYVIVYDRRGEGRSTDTNATFTYEEAIKDLNSLYKKYNIEKANIIAHSFGGLIGTLFAEQNPGKVNSLILAGALFSQQDTYDHILESVKIKAAKEKDSLMLSMISKIKEFPKNSAEYRKQCYEIASRNSYFKMPFPTIESERIRKEYELSEFSRSNIRNSNAPLLFYKNESRNNIDTKPVLISLKKKIKLFAVYGRQDNIFSEKQLLDMKKIVKRHNFKIINNCSHYLFVDQQKEFIDTIVKWIK